MRIKKLLKAFSIGQSVLVFEDTIDETQLAEENILIVIDNLPFEEAELTAELLNKEVKRWRLFLPVDGIDCPTLDIYTR